MRPGLTQPGSSHRTDQLELFREKRVREVWRMRNEVMQNLEKKTVSAGSSRRYIPGLGAETVGSEEDSVWEGQAEGRRV